jgi:hypothetical protein
MEFDLLHFLIRKPALRAGALEEMKKARFYTFFNPMRER